MGVVHVIGAGLAGLSAAVALQDGGRRIVLHEAARWAGGRCRSYHDPALGLTIDNGNHLLLSGNHAALGFVRRLGSEGVLQGPSRAEFPFADLRTGERWTLRPNEGRLPWWVLAPGRRVPGSRARDYLSVAGVMRARPEATIGEAMACAGPLYERLWRPVLLAALNTDPAESSAGLARAIIRETLAAGGRACRPLVAVGGLSAAFVDPALDLLRGRGADIRHGSRVRGIDLDGPRAAALDLGSERIALGDGDAVVLAVPAWVAADLVPGIAAPQTFRSIVNAHFRIAPPAGWPLLIGLVNALPEWLFAYPDRLSVTISGADRLLDAPREDLAAAIWREVAGLTGLPEALPPWQIVKERRATLAASPEVERRRPPTATRWPNLVLAGDWVATGLPGTIEGAIRSGVAAAHALTGAHGAPRAA